MAWICQFERSEIPIYRGHAERNVDHHSGMSIIMLTSTQFVNFTTADELAHNKVYAIDSAPDGVMWFGTYDSGISQEEY